MLGASIEHLTRHNTQFSEMVLDSWERPSPKDKTKECASRCGYEISIIQKNGGSKGPAVFLYLLTLPSCSRNPALAVLLRQDQCY